MVSRWRTALSLLSVAKMIIISHTQSHTGLAAATANSLLPDLELSPQSSGPSSSLYLLSPSPHLASPHPSPGHINSAAYIRKKVVQNNVSKHEYKKVVQNNVNEYKYRGFSLWNSMIFVTEWTDNNR